MKPYKNLSSKNLALLLMITRVTTVVSLLAVVLSLIGLASQFWMTRGFSPEESPDDLQINHQIRVEAHLVA
ncbi:hypothetical protein L5M18_22605 [Shewanella sp. SM20]|uniref:hypothetical protein n=1 Tax=Shewanella sp. SM20 TaxID=2912792 RepID=UPI0021D9700B|nr:hypothetical protein [Shewanella sp. SM20]MCU8094294.1 hypothetical protein [Shewanella sp. SM20]